MAFTMARSTEVGGPKTDAADKAFVTKSQQIADEYGSFDSRSETNILTLAPKAQKTARVFLGIFKTAHKDVRILSGTRTYAQQDKLYAQGRTTPGNIVTNARGGQSNHNFGIAWDIGLFEQGNYIQTDAAYLALANIVLPQMTEIEWGGNWTTLKDHPHYQIKAISESIAALRTNFEAGITYV